MFGMNQIIIRDNKGRFTIPDMPINDKNWLYQKYVIEKLTWENFYINYNISPTLLQNRLKKFDIKRVRKAWNKGTKGIVKSNSGSFKGLKGESAPNWRGGISTINLIIRGSIEYKLWRKTVFERDSYTCQHCGARNGNGRTVYIEADHIKPFALFPELRFAIDNGRTLCKDCHKKMPTFAGRKVH